MRAGGGSTAGSSGAAPGSSAALIIRSTSDELPQLRGIDSDVR
jgi:hypothetical protein